MYWTQLRRLSSSATARRPIAPEIFTLRRIWQPQRWLSSRPSLLGESARGGPPVSASPSGNITTNPRHPKRLLAAARAPPLPSITSAPPPIPPPAAATASSPHPRSPLSNASAPQKQRLPHPSGRLWLKRPSLLGGLSDDRVKRRRYQSFRRRRCL